jgi:hypothetical protein
VKKALKQQEAEPEEIEEEAPAPARSSFVGFHVLVIEMKACC